jgi:hypothetical protein
MKEIQGKCSFIRIGDTVINTCYINNIKISQDNYRINMMGNTIGSFMGSLFFNSGHLHTENGCILVSKDTYKEGYDKITKWLSDNNLDN